ncbi:MAG: hypothetical protein JSU69_03305, partial [Candidatus Zixiibacteriota bacterium]
MFNDLTLGKLPPYGKLFVALFSVLVIIVVVWMLMVGAMEAGIVGFDESAYEEEWYDEYEFEMDVDEIMSDEEAVTPPDWTDSGEQEPIEPEDIEKFEEEYEEEEYPFWLRFEDNAIRALEHIGSRAILYFAVGLIFMFTTYPAGAKKFFFWLLGILLILHVIGVTGHGFCWPANFL